MRKTKFSPGEYYHIYNRGVDKRDIYLEDGDYLRFLLGLEIFKNNNLHYNFKRIDIAKSKKASSDDDESQPLVEIVCYCLMPNHFHLLLKELAEGGISRFMHKIGTGYTNYFNGKCKRTGSLFQGPFKAVRVERDDYLMHLSRYIHLNPLDLLQGDWEEKRIKDKSKSLAHVREYPWSSLAAYLDPKIDSIPAVDCKIVSEQFKNSSGYTAFLKDWMSADTEDIDKYVIEKFCAELSSAQREDGVVRS